jgi:hypothetical protein
MPTFKSRGRRGPCQAERVLPTLDWMHAQRLREMAEAEETGVPRLKKEKKELLKVSSSLDVPIEEKLEAAERLVAVKRELRSLTAAKRDYLLSNAERVFGYFEQKKQLDEGASQATVVDNFFGVGRRQTGSGPVARPATGYFRDIDDAFLKVGDFAVDTDTCSSCGSGEMVPVEVDGLLICSHCSANRPYLVENDKPSYKEPPKEVCFYAYKRINHFREILAQFQAKESTQIPHEVLSAIKQQIKKERITLDQVTNKKAKDILKKLGFNKYYEHIPFIKDKLGIKPPIMCSELEETLCRLFMEIQAPYAKFCPEDRVNFLNYYYTVYKLCELLDQTQFLPFFPMLKDREKRIEQDEIWKKICAELGWEFIPTV